MSKRYAAALAVFAAAALIGVHVLVLRTFRSGGDAIDDGESGAAVPDAVFAPVVPESALGEDGHNGGGVGKSRLRGHRSAERPKAKASASLDPADYAALLAEARSRPLAPLRPVDREQYTIRINAWRRNEQLLVSLNHHSKCPGVALIQVVWCDAENEPPEEVLRHPSGKVVVERHDVNSLNERFHVLKGESPTLGILSMDDDVLRPCEAIDAGFFRWTAHPDRMVGFDARLHVPVYPDTGGGGGAAQEGEATRYVYGYKSSTEKTNRYSLTLPRYCFLHRDYLDLYMSHLPPPVFDRVADELNCEDIAMSFFVSALTGGRPPLLADYWAAQSQIKLYVPKGGISNTKDHKALRDRCVDDFMTALGVRPGGSDDRRGKGGGGPPTGATALGSHELWHRKNALFGWGAEPDPDPFAVQEGMIPRHRALVEALSEWGGDGSDGEKEAAMRAVQKMKSVASAEAVAKGLIEKTKEWNERWGQKV